jgi:hypothetical protein
MHVVQLLLPLYDNEKQRFARDLYDRVSADLTERFGGLTAYTRAPAAGLWRDGGEAVRDDVVVYEVMAGSLDRDWWRAFRERVERDFRQDHVIIRAQKSELL